MDTLPSGSKVLVFWQADGIPDFAVSSFTRAESTAITIAVSISLLWKSHTSPREMVAVTSG